MNLRSHALLLTLCAPWWAVAEPPVEQPVDLRSQIAAAIAEARAEQASDGHGRIEVKARAPASHGAAAAHGGHGAAKASAPTGLVSAGDPEAVWQAMMQGNLRFVSGRPRTREVINLRKSLAKGQKPGAIVLSCSDSRVPPELLFDQSLGDLFVVRTAGNVADPVALGSIEYAVEHLHTRLLVVLGHEECGAVAAAASGQSMPTPNLTAIVSRIRPAIDNLGTCGASPAAKRLRVELNASHSAAALMAESPIVREAVEKGEVKLLSAVYGLDSGVVTRLESESDAHGAAPTHGAHGAAHDAHGAAPQGAAAAHDAHGAASGAHGAAPVGPGPQSPPPAPMR